MASTQPLEAANAPSAIQASSTMRLRNLVKTVPSGSTNQVGARRAAKLAVLRTDSFPRMQGELSASTARPARVQTRPLTAASPAFPRLTPQVEQMFAPPVRTKPFPPEGTRPLEHPLVALPWPERRRTQGEQTSLLAARTRTAQVRPTRALLVRLAIIARPAQVRV